MKITKKLTMTLAILALSVSSCSKEDTPEPIVYQEINPLNQFLSNTGFNQFLIETVDYQFREYGFVFTPKFKGVIKAFVYKTPQATTPVRITLWDADTQTVLLTTMLQPEGAAIETIAPLTTPYQLVANKNYAVTVMNNDWYLREKSNFGSANYPIETDEITFIKCGYKAGYTQSFPNVFSTQEYWGDLSFKFQRN